MNIVCDSLSFNREPLLYSMSRCIVASRAAQKTIIDGVHMDISDDEGLTRSCIQGRDLGFDGKSLIHPSQIALTNSHYSPSEADVLHAHKIIQSFLSATASGKSVSVLDNKLVEKVRICAISLAVYCCFNDLMTRSQ